MLQKRLLELIVEMKEEIAGVVAEVLDENGAGLKKMTSVSNATRKDIGKLFIYQKFSISYKTRQKLTYLTTFVLF